MSRSNEHAALKSFVERCSRAVGSLVADEDSSGGRAHAVSDVVRMLAVLLASEQMPGDRLGKDSISSAADILRRAAETSETGLSNGYNLACSSIFEKTGYAIFEPKDTTLSDEAFFRAARDLFLPISQTPIDSIFFQTMPLSWLGCAYQGMTNRSRRKNGGVYYTPPSLVRYILESVISSENKSHFRILDPSMGGGDFLSAAVKQLSDDSDTGRAAAECVYGLDIDPMAVEISRFCVWAASGFMDDISDRINQHLICADALCQDREKLDWRNIFPEAFNANDGFDAVVGNPPYIASKNGLGRANSKGQSDTYILFIESIVRNRLVKPDGMFSMVLPDPMLVRENASEIRRHLMNNWTIESLAHILGAFREANVANIVPVCRNSKPTKSFFPACRIEYNTDRRAFNLRPKQTFNALAHSVRRDVILSQRRHEFLYLLEKGKFGDVIRHIHGPNADLRNYEAPFAPLKDFNIKAVYRGEEVGKSAIERETGDLPVILGGQSIKPYEIDWEGIRTNQSWVSKPIERYHSTKIIMQKSSARLVAALDSVSDRHKGFIFPQSVYGIELTKSGIDEIYLLCILNSGIMNEYLWRTVTGYKFIQPQIELEDIRALPIRQVSFITPIEDRKRYVAEGISIFENDAGLEKLSNFVASCLISRPERSDAVHDLLVHFGQMVIDFTRECDADSSSRLDSARAAVETIVRRIYSPELLQMDLL